jgi:hypothetical protein
MENQERCMLLVTNGVDTLPRLTARVVLELEYLANHHLPLRCLIPVTDQLTPLTTQRRR